MDMFFSIAADDLHLNAYLIDFESVDDRQRNISFRFAECVQADLALKRAIEDMIDKDVEK